VLVITRRRGIEQVTSPAVPAPGLRGLVPNVNGSAPPVGLDWPLHTPSYALGPPALPGHASFGMDSRGGSGRHLPTPATSIILVEPGNGNTGGAISGHGANVFRGTWDWAWRHAASPVCIVPLFSGFVQINNDPNSVAGKNFGSYWGQFAPSPGLTLRATGPRLNGGSDWQIWHLRSYQGDDGPITGYPVAVRDCFAHGNSGITTVTRNVIINGEFGFGVDELADFLYTFDGVTIIYTSFTDPLHAPPNLPHPEDPVGTDHGFGPLVGGNATQPNRFVSMRNLWAHTTGRNPLTSARLYTHANNLHYNHGRPGGGTGNGIHWHATNSLPMEANLLGNVFVRGPNNNNSLVAAACQVTIESGSAAFLSLNSQHGWAAPASQSSFMTSAPGGFVQGAYRTNALPAFWGDASLSGVLNFAANPLAPTSTELTNFVNLMRSSVGAQPGYRAVGGGIGRVTTVLDQIQARINGNVSTTSQFIDTVAQGGGWWSVPQVVVDPLSPGAHWWAPLPTGSDRDAILAGGTLLNGMSAAGYTLLEAWALNQHYYVGGQ
jgi:hypothetical protein